MTQTTNTINVLFVCLGNICRSPMAEAVFRKLVADAGLHDHIHIESAGTGNWHVGERPHRGTLAVLRSNHIDAGDKRARTMRASDMDAFDYIVAMDSKNTADIQSMFGRRVPRLMDFVANAPIRDVPDPYYNGAFDTVYEMALEGGAALLDRIRKEHQL